MHTKEPWSAEFSPVVGGEYLSPMIRSSSGHLIGIVYRKSAGGSENAQSDAARIVACVNACAGINPEAVPEFPAMCKMLLALLEEENPELVSTNLEWVREAIAKAEAQP